MMIHPKNLANLIDLCNPNMTTVSGVTKGNNIITVPKNDKIIPTLINCGRNKIDENSATTIKIIMNMNNNPNLL